MVCLEKSTKKVTHPRSFNVEGFSISEEMASRGQRGPIVGSKWTLQRSVILVVSPMNAESTQSVARLSLKRHKSSYKSCKASRSSDFRGTVVLRSRKCVAVPGLGNLIFEYTSQASESKTSVMSINRAQVAIF